MQGATVYLLAPEWNGALCRRSIPSLAVIDNTEFEGLSIFFTVCKLLDDSFFLRITIFLVFSVIISCVQNKLPTVWGRWPELRGSFETQKFGFIQTINFTIPRLHYATMKRISCFAFCLVQILLLLYIPIWFLEKLFKTSALHLSTELLKRLWFLSQPSKFRSGIMWLQSSIRFHPGEFGHLGWNLSIVYPFWGSVEV